MPHHHQHLHLHAARQHDWKESWDQMTKAVGDAFNPKKNQEQHASTKTIYLSSKTPTVAKTTQQQVKETPKVATTPTTSATVKPTTNVGVKAVAQSSSRDELVTATDSQLPSAIVPSQKATSVGGQLAVDTATPTPTKIQQAGTPLIISPSASATSSPSSSDSTAAKAGIALGVLGGIAVIFLAVFFCFKKRRAQMARKRAADDEKLNGPFGDQHAITDDRAAAALAVGAGAASRAYPDRRASRGANIAMVQSPGMSNRGGSAWERRPSDAQNPANPFGDNAERLNTPTAARQNQELPPVPQEAYASTAASPTSPIGTAMAGVVAGVAAGAAAGAAAGGLTRKASIRKDAPKALDLTLPPTLSAVPPSPAGTEFSMTSASPDTPHAPSASAAAIAAAGGPPASTVHRVQLDFKATLEDEMDLKAGQLIRLLHEYDDGWALCIRLDRSQQGVVPRTCLSTRPVKPRPNGPGPRGPPVNPQRGPGPNYPPGQRPMTPQGGPGYPRPQSPAGRPGQQPRPQSPYGLGPRSQSPGPRAQSPGPRYQQQGRPQSPGPRAQSPGPRYQQGRSQSPMGNRRNSPPSHGPSPMNQEYRPGPPPSGPIERRPVPGQAY